MSRCDEIQDRLILALSCAQEQEVRRHLDSCRQCHGFFSDLWALEEMTRELASTHQAPQDFHGAVMSRLPRHRLARSVLGYALLPVLLAASVLILGPFISANESDRPGAGARLVEDPLVPGDSEAKDYVDVVIEDPVRGRVIIRVPSVIHLQRTSEAQDFYVHKVSF